MKSIRRIYKIGFGPSSSHSMAPKKAAQLFRQKINSKNLIIKVELYGSLAATGLGHLTDKAIADGLKPFETQIIWKSGQSLPLHQNGMIFNAFKRNGSLAYSWKVYSIGGGELADDNGPVIETLIMEYPLSSISQVLRWCAKNKKSFYPYVYKYENHDIKQFLLNIWQTMKKAIRAGLISEEKHLLGPLSLPRRASSMLNIANTRIGIIRDLNLISAYALAVAEENAAGNMIVTAPTAGSCGVLPAVLYYFNKHHNISEETIINGLSTAGLFGSSVVERASISGADVGCQGEIGTASAMAAAAATQILGGSCQQIEYAAEMALEHFLGLTCDPVGGLVQIPCIERNAFAAMRSFECAAYALSTQGTHFVSFDNVVDVMKQTGRDMQDKYRETATGGLAEIMRKHFLRKEKSYYQ